MNLKKKLAVGASALLVGGSLGLLAAPAFAAPGDGGTGSVTVYKLEQTDNNYGPNDGSELPLTGETPLVAGFTACSIDGIDLAISSDWDRLKNLTVSLDGDGSPVVTEATEDGNETLDLTCGSEQTTNAGTGASTFGGLAADKAYVVYESTAAENAVTVASPTLLTVPFPGNGQAGQPTWNYSPHIYPKNIVVGSGATKTSEVVGDQVTFNITVPINPLGGDDTYTELGINDQLADSLEYTAAVVTLTDKDGADVALEEGDYTVTEPSESGGDEVVLRFTESGLVKINANIGGTVKLTITTTAISTGDTQNEAIITVNGSSSEPGTGPSIDEDEAEEFYSGAYIYKEAKNKGAIENVALAGAGFDVYTADASTTSCPDTPSVDETRVFANQTSDEDGETPSMVLGEGKYCVYEVVVPSGYKGLQGGMLLTVAGMDATVTVENTQVGADEGDLPGLPITGAAGTVLLLGGGIFMILLGFIMVVRRRRQEEEEAVQ